MNSYLRLLTVCCNELMWNYARSYNTWYTIEETHFTLLNVYAHQLYKIF